MHNLDHRELEIIAAIHRNHQIMLKNRMVTHFGVYFKQSEQPEKILSWIESLDDVRILTEHYLQSIAKSANASVQKTIENNTSTGSYLGNIIKSILPEGIGKSIFDPTFFTEKNPFSMTLVALNLDNSITSLLFDYFSKSFFGDKSEAQKQFAEMIESHKELSHIIKQECERLSVEIIKLFHFREMLLLGKMTNEVLEPNARAAFISKANLQNASNEAINIAIEIYYARELSKIFNQGFQSLYQVQDADIQNELKSPVLKWLNQIFESSESRLSFTQEIQLKFMQLSSEFLLTQMNEPGFLARHPKAYASIAGLIVGPIIAGALAIIFGGPFVWGIAAIAMMGFALTSIASYFIITKVDALAYHRNKANRGKIQQSIDMINNEFLRLQKEIIERKETSVEVIEHTRDFEKINQNLGPLIEGTKVARGSVAGWLREYAARYRHSKAVEVDLGDEYKEIIKQSRSQTKHLIKSINKNHTDRLDKWIKGTREYLKQANHQSVINDFELIQKIKEQVLEIISQAKYIPPTLFEFYCLPLTAGGLGGHETDFAHIRRLVPNFNKSNLDKNPYQYLCDTALNLFKKFEPPYANTLFFYGDADYRQMLGIPRGDHGTPLTTDNIDQYLKNSYDFLLSLCQKIKPGVNLDPLNQPARVTDEFILYRMLLLKQLATLCSNDNRELHGDVKRKIKTFIQNRFNLDPNVILDDLINQMFLLNKDVQTSALYKNNDGFIVTEVELDNITQAIGLDIAYNSVGFRLKDVLNHYINEFMNKKGNESLDLFGYNPTEQELSPQCTQQFVGIISRYCTNTSAFIEFGERSKALMVTSALDCYKYNASIQVYRAQLRVVRSLKELSKDKSHPVFHQQSEYLIAAFTELDKFTKKHCFALKINSAPSQALQFITGKIADKTPTKEWVKKLNSSDEYMKFIDQLPEEIQYPPLKIAPQTFFTPPKAGTTKKELEKALVP